MQYYTYAYLREDGTPYYVGKGEKNRIYKKGKCEVKPPKDKSKIIFLKQNLTEQEAFKHEIYMIVVFGRKDLGTGILRNRTNGGEGSSGLKMSDDAKRKIQQKRKLFFENGGKHPLLGKNHSEESKIKMSEVKKGKKLSEQHKENLRKNRKGMLGKTHSQETKEKIRKNRKGIPHNEETKLRLSEINTGKKWWNDGIREKFCVDSPGIVWNLGRLYRPRDLNGKFV